jgi:hypothetical protein
VLAVPVGLLASAILVVNNVRDLETDRRAGKRTLAVRLGRERTRGPVRAMVAGAFVTAQIAVAARLARRRWLLCGCARSRWRCRGADGADALRRPGAQRRAGRDGASSSWRSASCSRAASWRADEARGRGASLPVARSRAASWGVLTRRDLLRVRLVAEDG